MIDERVISELSRHGGKRPRRKSSHQSLVEEADAWVTAIVVNRQNGMCLGFMSPPPSVAMRCGGGMQGAHILRKGGIYNSIRHDLENVVGMCRNHHLYWSHLYEYDFYQWIEALYPGRIEKLKQVARDSSGKIDLKELICVLKSIHKQEQS